MAQSAGETAGITVHQDGTVVVVPGPRFATRAEWAYYRRQGWSVINMTQYPEAALARELGICYCGIALITDFDTGVDGDASTAAVTMQEVFEVLRENVERSRLLLLEAIPAVPPERTECSCASALDMGPLGP